MNVWGWVVLAALVVDFALARLADALNVRAFGRSVPPELRDVYDAARHRRVVAYVRDRTRFGALLAGVELAALLAFWFAGGFGALDRAVRAVGLGPVGTGLLFVGALGLARIALGLPFRWWSTFQIEERHGFNRTTPRVFWADLAKGLVLALVLGGPFLAAVLWLFQVAGPRAWLWCWLAAALWTLGVQYVAPTWILPLFNRFTPLPDGTLREAILGYARTVDFPLAGVFVIDGSRRSTKANALFTGFGRRKRIALFDTLVDALEPPEVVAVVAHEVGHYKRGHVLQGTALGIVQTGVLFLLLSLLLATPAVFAAFGVAEPSVHAGLVLFALVLAPIEVVLAVALQAWSRRNERQADAYAVATTGAGAKLAAALARLSTDSLAHPTPHPLYVALHYSHPPLGERLRALRSS
ncbi:MAG TPA: M48 family metallopeptidase [Candidatus Binatia bacterium]|nr:M48 family metallopeptidase [Candidatus Binatia bacterium]